MSSTELILVLATCLTAVASIGFAAFVAVSLRKQFVTQVSAPVVKDLDLIPTDQYLGNSESLALVEQPLQTAISHLRFAESWDAQTFSDTSRELALSDLAKRMTDSAADGLSITINSVRLLQSSAEMTVTATKGGQLLLSEGTATIARHGSGKALPMIVDAKNGQVVEIMKEAKSAQAAARLASVGAAVVGAAHIISGADIANRLKEVDAKINLLLAYRRIDQMAALERIYTSARELCVGMPSEESKTELWRLRGELRELRICWRRELQHQLGLIDDPNAAAWYQKMFQWIPPVERAPHTAVHGKITEGQLHIALIEYSLRLDHTLAAASGTLPAFEATLAEELAELSVVAELLKSKATLISTKFPELSVDSTTRGLAEVIKQYGTLLPVELDIAPKFILKG
jgi:hypothetical protein